MWKKRWLSGALALSMLLSGLSASAAQGGTGQGEPKAASVGTEYSTPVFASAARSADDVAEGSKNLALNAAIKASHVEGGTTFFAENAVDGDFGTRWASGSWADKNDGDEWLILDLGEQTGFNTVIIKWEAAFASNYTIDTSSELGDVADMTKNVAWDTTIYTETANKGGTQELRLHDVSGRYVRLHMTKTTNDYGASIFELQLYNRSEQYYASAGAQEMGALNIQRYPRADFTLPTKASSGTPVSWESTNDAVTLSAPNDKGVITATVTPADVDKSGNLSATVTYGFATDTVAFAITVKAADDQLTEYSIYPKPQSVDYTTGQNPVVTDTINVVVKSSAIDEITRARATEVLENHGMTARFVTEAEANAQTDVSKLTLDVYDMEHDTMFTGTALALPEGGALGEENVYDAHAITIAPSANGLADISITGKHNSAAYYALASLDQILDQRQEKSGAHTLSTAEIIDYANSKYRGIIEGFYGYAYSKSDIESLLSYGKRYKMNTFMYGPKADPYHLGSWRDAYPTTLTDEQRKNGMLTQDDIREIAQMSKDCGIDFVWTVHPMMQGGVDITTTEGVNKGVGDVLAKYEMMYNLGVRHFGLFVDDISTDLAVKNSENQAKLIGDVTAQWKTRHAADFKPLFYVPTIYSFDAANEDGKKRNFKALADLGNIDDIIVTFTGEGVWSTINNKQMTDMANYLEGKQKPMFWWNSPVNDNMDQNMFLGPLDQRYDVDGDVTDAVGMMTNPLNQAEASKVSLFGMLDYSWNIADFDAEKNWSDSFQTIVSDPALRDAFTLFSANSAPNGIMGDKTGVTYSGVEALIAKLKATSGKTPENMAALRDSMSDWRDACAYLQQNLKGNADAALSKLYDELAPWIAKSHDVADLAVKCLDLASGADRALQTYYDAVYQNAAFATLPQYQTTSLEGAGLDVYEQQQEVLTGGSALMNYVPTLLSWAQDAVAGEIPAAPADLSPTLLTGGSFTGEPVLSAPTADGFSITGLKGIVLPRGAYVGASFTELASFKNLDALASALPSGVRLQYATDGKSWSDYKSGSAPSMSAVRFINKSRKSVAFTEDKLTISVQMLSPAKVKAVTNSGRGQYQNNPLANLADGDWTTSYWSSGSPKAGEWFQIEYASAFQFADLTMAFDTGDNLDEKAKLEVSADGENWTSIGVLNGDTMPEIREVQGKKYQIFTLSDINTSGKYIRWTITEIPSGYSNYMRCYEVVPNDGLVPSVITAESGKGMTMLLDGNPATLYVPTGADSVTYQILAPQKISAIIAYLKADTLPKAEVLAAGKWQEVSFRAGTTAYAQVLDTAALSGVAALRLSWTEQTRPAALFDLSYVTGTGEDSVDLTPGSSGGGSDSGSTGGGSGTGTVTPPSADKDMTTATVTVDATVKDGQATATVSAAQVNTALEQAKKQAEKNGTTANGVRLALTLKTGADATGLEVTLPDDAAKVISEDSSVKALDIESGVLTLSLDRAAINAVTERKGTVVLRAAKPKSETLSAFAKSMTDGRAVFDLTATQDGNAVTDFAGGTVTVSIPYTLRSGEAADRVCALYINAAGEPAIVSGSKYDTEKKAVVFATNHFSSYGIGYRSTTFTDIVGHWAETYITFTADRKVFTGTSDTTFSPEKTMTRGMFVTALGRLSGADVSVYTASSFGDVKAGSYYLPYIEWAAKNGIVKGVGENRFAPDADVTREQMAAILVGYASAMNQTLNKTTDATGFGDSANVSAWAATAVQTAQQSGLMSGDTQGNFNPLKNATRAEASTIIARYLNLTA